MHLQHISHTKKNEDFRSFNFTSLIFPLILIHFFHFSSILFWNIKKVPIFAPLLAKERDVAQSG